MTPTELARQAAYDQASAYFREHRKRMCQLQAAMRKRDWHRKPANVHTLAKYLYDEAPDEYKRAAIGWAICDAKKYRTEFVIARCLECDSKYRG